MSEVACGIEGSTPFCLEGTDGPEGYIVATNILNMVFPGCNAGEYGYSFCDGTTIRADANEIGGVSVIDYYIDNDCRVRDGVAGCIELHG